MREITLKDKAINGVSWSFVDNFANTGISFLVGLILARLLSPSEYGLIGIISIFIALFSSIVNSGFSNALIRKKDVESIDYNTVFLFNMIISCVLYGLILFLSPLISSFFRKPELVPIMRVMSIIIILNAFSVVQQTILIKRIDFKTQTKISVIASLLSGVLGIIMAVSNFGVWSLVGQQISRQLLNTILLWIFNTWRPNFLFSIQSFKELFSFGWKLLVSGLIDTLWKQIFQIVIGKWYSADSLGQYTRAEQFSSIFSTNLTTIVQRVSYPVLSTFQDNPDQLKFAYKKVIKTTMLITFVCMLGLAAIAKPLILVLIGEKWLPSAYMLQIVCFSAMLYPLHAINLNMLQVMGRSDLFLKLEIIKKIIAFGPILLGIFINIFWMLWGSVFVGFICYYLNSFYSGRDLNYGFYEQLKDVSTSFVIASLMAILVYLVTFIQISEFIMLPLQLVIGFGVVILTCEMLRTQEYIEIKTIIKKIFLKIGNQNK